MLELLQSLPWPLVCGAALFVAHRHGNQYWAVRVESKLVSDQQRLAAVETEVRALIAAQNMKGLHR